MLGAIITNDIVVAAVMAVPATMAASAIEASIARTEASNPGYMSEVDEFNPAETRGDRLRRGDASPSLAHPGRRMDALCNAADAAGTAAGVAYWRSGGAGVPGCDVARRSVDCAARDAEWRALGADLGIDLGPFPARTRDSW